MKVKNETTSDRPGLSVIEMMAWVAGLAAIVGLIEEIIRHTKIVSSAGLVGALLVLYILHISLSIPAFWKAPRMVIPATMLVGGVLWTLVLQVLNRLSLPLGVVSLLAVPLLTLLGLRWAFPSMSEPDEIGAASGRPSTVHFLLEKDKGFGHRSPHVRASTGSHR